jgi:4-alpha-glucanotransferase
VDSPRPHRDLVGNSLTARTAAARARGRQAGLLLPLSACPSIRSWGIGEIGDMPAAARWMLQAGLRIWQLLPVHEMAPGQSSPYTVLSAMAIDPIYISLPLVAEFQDSGGEAALDGAASGLLAHLRAAPAIDYWGVRTLKGRVLRTCFTRFVEHEWAQDSERARAFRTFADENASWLEDYALFRAIHHASGERAWTGWDGGVRDRERHALAEARSQLRQEVLYREYLQWLAHGQWQAARIEARGVRIFGDFPFTADSDSADVWAGREMFSLDGTVGAPPDAFSETGQDWGLPVFRWHALREDGYAWFRDRAVRTAQLFDGFRVDHVVGLFRTWVFPGDSSSGHFEPDNEPDQIAQGEAVLQTIVGAGAQIVAEDLGTIPDFVRDGLRRMGIPGYKVLRWERHWHTPDMPFCDPREYPADSLATTGTHDTETLATWWNQLSQADRSLVLQIPSLDPMMKDTTVDPDSEFTTTLRDALLEMLFASGSDLLVLPYQDVFGWTDRINVPATVDKRNWTARLRWAVDTLDAQPEAVERRDALREWSRRYGRVGG